MVTCVENLQELDLLPLLLQGLSPTSCPLPHLLPFFLRLTARLLHLPGLAPCLLPALKLPDLISKEWDQEDHEEDEWLCPLLELVTTLQEQDHLLPLDPWHLLLLPLAQHLPSCQLYTRRAVTSCFTSYFRSQLRRSLKNGARVEELLTSFISWGQKEGREEEVAELLTATAKVLEKENLDSLLAPLVSKKFNFSSLFAADQRKTSSILKLFVLVHEDQEQLTSCILRLLNSASCPLNLKKVCVRLGAERPQLLASFLDHLLQEQERPLLLHLLSLHPVPRGLQSSLSSILPSLTRAISEFSEDPSEDCKYVRAVCDFLIRLLDSDILEDTTTLLPLLPQLLSTSSLHLSVGEGVRCSLLSLLSSLLPTLPYPSLLPPGLLPSLTSLALQTSSWPVQDSALSCISSFLTSPLLPTPLPPLLSTISLLLTTPQVSYVKASAIRTATSLSSSSCSLSCSQLISLFPFSAKDGTITFNINPESFFEDHDEASRRELVRLATATYIRLLKEQEEIQEQKKMLNLLEQFILFLQLQEQDWETKVLCAQFWKEGVGRSAQPQGLVLGCGDYEDCVRSVFRRLLKQQGLGGRCVKVQPPAPGPAPKVRRIEKEGSVGNEADQEENIEGIFGEPYESLVEEVLRRKRPGAGKEEGDENRGWQELVPVVTEDHVQAMLQQQEEHELRENQEQDPGKKLEEVLEDILHSRGGLIDLVDCY